MSDGPQHSWPRIFGVFATGVAAAFLIGKVPAALPALRSELGFSLVQAGFLVSLLSLIAAVSGVFIGALSEISGQRRTGLIGLCIGSLAGIGGTFATEPGLLLAMRALEGIGFFMVSVSLPGLIIQLSDDRRRQSAMGLWGAYLPFGSGLILLFGGLAIASIGWRGLWLIISAVLIAMMALLYWAAPERKPVADPSATDQTGSKLGSLLPRIAQTLRSRGSVMLAVTFGCYSGQYLAVTSFVPLILVEQSNWALASAAAITALIMISNSIGNVAAGLLLDKGVQRGTLIVVAAVAMAAGATLVMNDTLPASTRLAGAFFFSILGGLIPGALFAGVRQHAVSPAHVSTVNGLMLQAVAIGQFIGPAVATWLVSVGGYDWSWALLYLLPMACLTGLAGFYVGKIERRPEVPVT